MTTPPQEQPQGRIDLAELMQASLLAEEAATRPMYPDESMCERMDALDAFKRLVSPATVKRLVAYARTLKAACDSYGFDPSIAHGITDTPEAP